MEGWSEPKKESVETEPLYDYTFFDYTNRMEPEVIFSVSAHNNNEAFTVFEKHFGRKFGSSNVDGFNNTKQGD